MSSINLTCIIDDDPIFAYGIQKLMEHENYCLDFLIFNDGKEALDGLQPILHDPKKAPDLILLDINMPVMDGWQFLDELSKRSFPKKSTLYIVSSSIDPADHEKAKSYDLVDDFIVKPITTKDLAQLVARQKTAISRE